MPIFSPEKSISFLRDDDKSVLGSIQRKKMGIINQKMAVLPLKHPKNALFFKSSPKWIYFWPYSIKGSYLEYQKQGVKGGH